MLQMILRELKAHAPFTAFGAFTGIALMVILVTAKVGADALGPAFEGAHALHVFLSAVVTAAMYRRYGGSVVLCVLVGFVGSVGIATLSDVVFPHHGGAAILKLTGENAHMRFHLPAVEEWWLINPAALLGIAVGVVRPRTRLSHAGHVLLSTWASLFYVVSNAVGTVNWFPLMPLVLVVLFIAVWVPCCISDIVFPLLFVPKTTREALGHAGGHG
jgi:hypothetical protein